MTSIHVKFRASTAEGREGTLYYCLIHQRMVRWISSGYCVFLEEWSDRKECVVVGKRHERAAWLRLVQAKVDWEMRQMQRIISDKESLAEACSIDELARIFRNMPQCQSVFSFIERHISNKEQMQRIGTSNNYLHAYRRFRDFMNGEDLAFSQMTAGMLERYEAWLIGRGLRQNSVAFYLRNLRTLYRKAVAEGYADDCDIFSGVQTGSTQTTKRAISVADIRRIEQLELPEGSSLDLARDFFLFSFYLRGMSFVDMAFLKKTDLRCGTLTYSRRKTNHAMSIEWERPMQAIVDKYAGQTRNSPYMLPIITGKESSPYLRYKSVEQNVNRNLKKIGKLVGLKIPLTTYVARHSWASIAMRMDIPMATISEGMGHSSFRTTQIYLESIDVSTVNQANKKILAHVLGNL